MLMCQHLNKRFPRRPLARRNSNRRGLTLPELIMSIGVMSMVALALAGLSTAVLNAQQYADSLGTATQHARVAIHRIENTIAQATASDDFPGMTVISTPVGSYSFPDTLVVWKPTGSPASPTGPPLYRELVIFCPDPAAPNRLVEITVPNDGRTTPALSDASAWRTNIEAIKTSTAANKVVLTDMIRAADAGSGGAVLRRGAVRFTLRVRPSLADWAGYKAGTSSWSSLPWVQDIYGSQTGLRQSWCTMELQLVPRDSAASTSPNSQDAMPFFGSAALFYEMHK